MYSVVMLMAMTSGGDAPAGLLKHHSCSGCTGAPVAAPCAPACPAPVYASCTGGHHKLFGGHKHHSCTGATYAGCTGYVAPTCVGTPYAPMGCAGSYPVPMAGCVGTPMPPVVAPPVVMPPKKDEQKKETTPPPREQKKDESKKDEQKKDDKKDDKKEEISAPATLIVNVPTDAVLTVDGNSTSSTSAQRVFESPALLAGQEFHYTLKATFTVEGKQVTVSKVVAVSAGNQTVVDFNTLAVASR